MEVILILFLFYNTLQGEVEQISLMKPKAQGPHDEGFLEYLEDIIGTNQYVEKIDEAFKQCVLSSFFILYFHSKKNHFVCAWSCSEKFTNYHDT